MSTTIDIGTFIVRTPSICGGRPRIAGTRISVQNIALEYNSGMSPEAIAKEIPYVNLAQIYAALAYYYANQEVIEMEIKEYVAESARLEAEYMAGKL